MQKRFGVYIHIPYCIQRCTYCDFATYVQSEILPPQKYIELIKKEIQLRRHYLDFSQSEDLHLDTLYFGGGTPSLIPSELIVDLISELNKQGLKTSPQTEITIEINPATVSEKKLNHYLENGFNRFSVGAQTFHDRLLKMVKREHSSDQTKETLALLRKYNLNFSFDLLFALPTQTLAELKQDVLTAVDLGSSHISPYCLTVPEGHPLSFNRPLDEEQIEMFNVIHENLNLAHFKRYEISNYGLSGFESQHNLLYWQDQDFWGLGLSAHSYSKKSSQLEVPAPWGSRYWNPNNIQVYENQINQGISSLDSSQIEFLAKHQALTDFCHTSLRLETGLQLSALHDKFDENLTHLVSRIAAPMVEKKLLTKTATGYRLTNEGILISNQIFEKFTFLEVDIL